MVFLEDEIKHIFDSLKNYLSPWMVYWSDTSLQGAKGGLWGDAVIISLDGHILTIFRDWGNKHYTCSTSRKYFSHKKD